MTWQLPPKSASQDTKHPGGVPRIKRAMSGEQTRLVPGNCRVLSGQLARNISRNAGKYPRNGWHNSQEASGQLTLKFAQQFL